jgi:hypothetical protein
VPVEAYRGFAGGLDPEKKYQLLVLPEPVNPLEELFGTDLDKERETTISASIEKYLPELGGALRYATQLRELMREPTMLMMPFWMDIK